LSDSDREETIVAISKQLDETSAGQMAATNLRAVIAMIPFVGGAFSTLATELIPNWKLQRLNRFVAALKVDLEALGNRIDIQYLKKEEFGYILEKTFRAVVLNYQDEKLGALRNVLLNSMVRTDIKQDVKEYLLHLTESLDTLHMRFLALLRNPSEYYRNKQLQDNPHGSMMTELRKCFPELADGTMRAVWNDLYNYGIVSVTPNLLGAGISPIGSEALVGRLSEFGKLLVDFIGSPS
jgi:hypothetical protein